MPSPQSAQTHRRAAAFHSQRIPDKITHVKLHRLAVLFLPACLAQTPNPYASDPSAPEAGRGIFRIYCAPCHGLTAQGGRGPDLTLGVYAAGENDADLHRVIVRGVPGSEMPEFADRVGADNIWKVVAYIRSAARKDKVAANGDPANGEKLFWSKGQCGRCHVIGPKGGTLGPELSIIGRKRSAKHLREAIVDVDKDITPGYFQVVVDTQDGKQIRGVQRGFDNFSAQLETMDGKYRSFLRDEVKSLKREFRSMMPGNYGKLFSADEVDDLVAYMSGLKGKTGK